MDWHGIPEEYRNQIVTGDARVLAKRIPDESVDLVFWSGPYFVGKQYEQHLIFESWLTLLQDIIHQSARVLKPGRFLIVNCADILAFPDENLKPIRGNVLSRCLPISRDDILPLMDTGLDKYQVAEKLGVSEQTVDRRLNGNNARGKKSEPQTRIELIQPRLAQMANAASLYLYDRRIWVKDPAWESCQWHTVSYRSIDEFEYLLVFLKPGVVTINRARLTRKEWAEWGSRGVWSIPSVRANDIHEAMFPKELARRVVLLYSEVDEIVVDFFVGSGTTAIKAKELNRRWLAFEINPTTAEQARERVRLTQPPLFVLEPEQLELDLIK